MSVRCKLVWASLFAAAVMCGVFAELGHYKAAGACTAWMVFVVVCNIVAEYRSDKRAALRQQDGSGY